MNFFDRLMVTATIAGTILLIATYSMSAPKITCSDLQRYVDLFGRSLVEAEAKRRGHTDREIAYIIKKCKITELRSMQDASRKPHGLLQETQEK